MSSINGERLRSSAIPRAIPASPAPIRRPSIEIGRDRDLHRPIPRYRRFAEVAHSAASSTGPLDYYYYHYPPSSPPRLSAPDIQAA